MPQANRCVGTWCLAVALAWSAHAIAAPPLPELGVKPRITVSGLSSGGYMAAQFAVAFSSIVAGVGVVAGGPFDCAQGDVLQATTRCSCVLEALCSTPTPSVLAFQTANRARGKAAVGQIDPLAGLKQQRVWLMSGGKDHTVPPANVEALKLFYVAQMKLPAKRLKLRHLKKAGHGLPVDPEPTDAVDCGLTEYPYLTHCDVDAAGEMLRWLYPGARAAATAGGGQLLEFNQAPYFADLGYTGLADIGYLYVPDDCTLAGARCRLHVVFHGCRQSRESEDGRGGVVGDLFARESGFNRWAVEHRTVVLYPQVQPVDTRNPMVPYLHNPRACWDFWGYTQPVPFISRQVTNMGPQMLAVRAMVAALLR